MLIGLIGKRGVGKTSLANDFVKELGYKKFSIADDIRTISEEIFTGISTAPKEKKFDVYEWTPREFMIDCGNFIRFYDRDYFLNRCLSRALKADKAVIDDVRYPHEYDEIKKLGGKIIRIERYWKYNPYKRPLNDPSETSLDRYGADYNIFKEKNISIEDLYADGEWALTTWGMK